MMNVNCPHSLRVCTYIFIIYYLFMTYIIHKYTYIYIDVYNIVMSIIYIYISTDCVLLVFLQQLAHHLFVEFCCGQDAVYRNPF